MAKLLELLKKYVPAITKYAPIILTAYVQYQSIKATDAAALEVAKPVK